MDGVERVNMDAVNDFTTKPALALSDLDGLRASLRRPFLIRWQTRIRRTKTDNVADFTSEYLQPCASCLPIKMCALIIGAVVAVPMCPVPPLIPSTAVPSLVLFKLATFSGAQPFG